VSAPSPAETAVGAFGLFFGLAVIDDPAYAWLQGNGIRLLLVGASCSFVAFVVCLLSPETTFKILLGRILAGGVCGSAATAVAGSVHASGAGPTVTAFIVIFIGVGGVYFLLAMRQYFESKQASGELVGWFGRVVERILGQLDRFLPRSQSSQKVPADGPTATTIIGPLYVDRRVDAGGNAPEPRQRVPGEQAAAGPAPSDPHGNRETSDRGEQEVRSSTPGT
jgi:hypothetical protein